jgi:hypothetical protein
MRFQVSVPSAMVAALCAATSAGAATLSTADGDVLVNGGRGFVRGQAGQNLNPGDRVMVGRGGGNATISYDLSCFERVTIGTVSAVRTGIPCQTTGATTTPSILGNVPTEVIVLGGAAAVGAGVLIYQAAKSTSP